MVRKIENIKTESDIKLKGTYAANLSQKEFSFRVSTPKQRANKTRNLGLIDSMKRTEGQFSRNFFELRSRSQVLNNNPEEAIFAKRAQPPVSPQLQATSFRESELSLSQLLASRVKEGTKPSPALITADRFDELLPSSPTAIRTTKIKPIVMDGIKFNVDGGYDLLSSKREEINKKKTSLITSNPGLIKFDKDELAGKKHQKIKLDKFSFQWSHPLFKYDEKTADAELAKKDEEFEFEEQRAYCKHYDIKEDKYVWEECRIIGKYEEGRYIIYWTKSKQRKIVDRLNLRFASEMDGEAGEEAERRFDCAMKKRHIDIYNESLKSSLR